MQKTALGLVVSTLIGVLAVACILPLFFHVDTTRATLWIHHVGVVLLGMFFAVALYLQLEIRMKINKQADMESIRKGVGYIDRGRDFSARDNTCHEGMGQRSSSRALGAGHLGDRPNRESFPQNRIQRLDARRNDRSHHICHRSQCERYLIGEGTFDLNTNGRGGRHIWISSSNIRLSESTNATAAAS
jgi:hypothetical protein